MCDHQYFILHSLASLIIPISPFLSIVHAVEIPVLYRAQLSTALLIYLTCVLDFLFAAFLKVLWPFSKVLVDFYFLWSQLASHSRFLCILSIQLLVLFTSNSYQCLCTVVLIYGTCCLPFSPFTWHLLYTSTYNILVQQMTV